MDRLKEDAGAWTAERACGNQSCPTARRPPRIVSLEWLGPNRQNLMHNHPEVAIKNWALRWTDGGHHWRQNSRMTARNRTNALLALSGLSKNNCQAEDRPANGNWARDQNIN